MVFASPSALIGKLCGQLANTHRSRHCCQPQQHTPPKRENTRQDKPSRHLPNGRKQKTITAPGERSSPFSQRNCQLWMCFSACRRKIADKPFSFSWQGLSENPAQFTTVTGRAASGQGSCVAASSCGDGRISWPAFGRSVASFDRCSYPWSWPISAVMAGSVCEA